MAAPSRSTPRGGRGRTLRPRPFAALVLAAVVTAGLGVVDAAPASAAVIDVTTTADGGPGSLRAAFQTASGNSTNDTINLQADATYTVCGQLIHFDAGRSLTVNGNGATIVRSCPQPNPHQPAIFNGNGDTLALDDLTIRGAGGSSAAVHSAGTADNQLFLNEVEITGSTSSGSGGAAFASGYVEITDSVLSGNTAGGTGGAVKTQPPYQPTGDTLVITDSQLTGNRADTSGGAVDAPTGARVSLVRSNISGNTLTNPGPFGNGGGIRVGGMLSVFWSTISHNASHGPGAAINHFGGGDLTIWASTVSNNRGRPSSPSPPNAVSAGGDVSIGFSTIVHNPGVDLGLGSNDLVATATVLGPGPQSCATGGTTTSGGYNVETGDSCGFGAGVGDRTDVADLGLHHLADNGGTGPTHHPTWSGGLIDTVPGADAGCDNPLFGVDQRLIDRPVGTGCEPGAVEFSPSRLPAHPFVDVPAWVEESVRWIWFYEYATGFAGGQFRPDLELSRAQLVRMLYRIAGSPAVGGLPPHGLSDVPPWVEDAVRWAAFDPPGDAPAIMTGFADLTFRPDLTVTRAQLVNALYRRAGSPDVAGLPAHGLSDVPPWVENAVRWAVHDPAGSALPVMTGFADATFRPTEGVTRAQATRALHRASLLP